MPTFSPGGSRSGKYWLFPYTGQFSWISEAHNSIMPTADGVKHCFMVRSVVLCCLRFLPDMKAMIQRLGQVRYLLPDI